MKWKLCKFELQTCFQTVSSLDEEREQMCLNISQNLLEKTPYFYPCEIETNVSTDGNLYHLYVLDPHGTRTFDLVSMIVFSYPL